MKKLIFLLIAISGTLSAQVFADSEDNSTEAVSVSREVACNTGFCPTPVDTKQASLVDRMRSKQLVDWIMNDGTGTPPQISDSTTSK